MPKSNIFFVFSIVVLLLTIEGILNLLFGKFYIEEVCTMDFTTIISELLDAAPYSVILVIGFFAFYHLHKLSIKTIKENSEKAVSEIKEAYEKATDKVISFYGKF